jgi:effector-binding domain-containing protein
MDWVENGPIREIYLVNPGEVKDFSELVTEVQVPATAAR